METITRRGFFQFAGVGAAALLVPSAVSYFLPPSGGWTGTLTMRKIEQYIINTDEICWRYDAAWSGEKGESFYHVFSKRECDETARMLLNDRMMPENGIPTPAQKAMPMPRLLGPRGEYV